MEKIYMEDNNKQKESKALFNFSIVLSFAVAIFAIFSLAMFAVVSNQKAGISYAISPTGDTFTFYKGTAEDGTTQLYATGYDVNGAVTYRVPLYFAGANNTKPIFCVEHTNTNVATGTNYQKGKVIDDYGLLYLLSNSFVNEKKVANSNDYVEAWITQVAIWMYLAETQPQVATNAISAEDITKIKNTTTIKVNYNIGTSYDKNFGESIYNKYISKLISDAKAASNVKKLTVTKANGEISKTSDGKFYQTPMIVVAGEDLVSYDVSFKGIDGVKIVDEDGRDLALTNITPAKKFYARIPVDKVGENIQTLTIVATGKFNTLTGSYYIPADGSNKQKVVSVTGATTQVSEGVSMEIVGAPDTGKNTAQTIYFIGLVVILCGVGIVYANAKPVATNQ